MSAAGTSGGGVATRRPLVGSVRAAYVTCAVIFVWAVAQFYRPGTGFTNLIQIGDRTDPPVTELHEVPHYVYERSAGYDGAYYVQFALNPTLRNPELKTAIDNPIYRARRILMGWVAWLAGLGQPAWIVQAYALINVASWLGLAVVLLRWFPATSWENFLRWGGVMFSQGLCMSVHDSLVDGPALLFVALAMAAWENGRRGWSTAWLALGGLSRETSLLAATGLAPWDKQDRTGWVRFAKATVLAALPLAAWMIYVQWRLGPMRDAGLNNFTLPLAGLAEKWGTVVADMAEHPGRGVNHATLAFAIALTVQFLFFALRWRPREAWWRVGATFAVLLMFLAQPVWEGYPGAAARALLPMALAFNILVPRQRGWLIVLLAGNLSIVAAYREFDPPVGDFFSVSGEPAVVAAVRIEPSGHWYDAEHDGGQQWPYRAPA